MKRSSLMVVVAFVLVFTFALTACKGTPVATPTAEKTLKIAFVHYGPFNDQGWGQDSYAGFMAGASAIGAETAASESVAPADYETVILDYAARGYDLVIANANDMEDAVKVAAAQYPNTFFIINSGRISNDTNIASIAIAEWQEGYFGGTAAASVTKTGKIAFFSGQDIPIMITVQKGFQAAAAAVNPDVEALASYVGSWTDVQKASELASAFVDQGVDVIMAKADGGQIAALTVVHDRGIMAIGSTGNVNDIQPDNIIGSARSRVDVAIQRAVTEWAAGRLPAGIYTWGAKEGVEDWVWNEPFKAQYPDLVTLLDQVNADLISGKITEPK